MVLAAWFKRRQFEKGYEKGLEIGRAESRRAMRKLHNAKLRSVPLLKNTVFQRMNCLY